MQEYCIQALMIIDKLVKCNAQPYLESIDVFIKFDFGIKTAETKFAFNLCSFCSWLTAIGQDFSNCNVVD